MHDLAPFGLVLALVAMAVLVALAAGRVAARTGVPAPALLLLIAAALAQVIPRLGSLSVVTDQRIVTVALVVILFDGGMHIGWTRMRAVAGAVLWLGVVGTVVTGGAVALGTHYLFGFGWRTALLIGAALAPTDPAVVFSVLGPREIIGRCGTLLEGESGANDPVGIAVLVSLLGASGGGWSALGSGVAHFGLQLGVGAAVGVAGGWLMRHLLRRVSLPAVALYPVLTFAVAVLLYGGASALDGSGFLAVFVAGIAVGDVEAEYTRATERFAATLSSLAEIVAFVVLGLSVRAASVFGGNRFWLALGIAALLIVVVRPLLVGALLLPVRLERGERWFVALVGLKGAVPILLATFVLAENAPQARTIYDIVVVVVLASVLGQGALVPVLARRLHVPMRVRPRQPAGPH